VLPPITRGAETLEGAALLAEVEGDPGLVLFQSLRNVLLWAAAPEAERAAVFARAAAARRAEALSRAGLDERLRPALHAIAELLASPAEFPRARVAWACAAVARWAEERGAPATALAYMQAAALAEPGDAALAYAVGRLARQHGEPVRAEGWLHKAVVLARQSGDWSSYAMAFAALGNLAVQRGNLPAARRMHTRALRAAQRHRLRQVQAMALHDLFVTAMELGDGHAATEYAGAALRAYGDGHPRVPALAHDVACFWTAAGEFARALPVFRAALPHIPGRAERAVVLANVARAAAGTGDRRSFEDAAAEAASLVEQPDAERGAAQVWLNLARGAASLGDAPLAAMAAETAARAAARRGEAKILASAEAIAQAARAGSSARAAEVTPPGTAEDPGDVLAAELVRSLAAVG
jgi:tetratricopeptide (TPR) repeat protein